MATPTHEFQSEYARRYFSRGKAEGDAQGRSEGRTQGRAEGQATAVVAFLEARGVDVPDAEFDRITRCRDLDQLDTWIRRAAVVESVRDLFTD